MRAPGRRRAARSAAPGTSAATARSARAAAAPRSATAAPGPGLRAAKAAFRMCIPDCDSPEHGYADADAVRPDRPAGE